MMETSLDICIPELANILDRWRIPTIPNVAAQGIMPHITLLYPWRPVPLREADIEEVESIARDFIPFTLTFQRLGRFPEVIFLQPEPVDILTQMIDAFTLAFPDTPPYQGRFTRTIPHLTVAKASTMEEFDRLEDAIYKELRPYFPLVFNVKEIAIEEQNEVGLWSIRKNINLGPTP